MEKSIRQYLYGNISWGIEPLNATCCKMPAVVFWTEQMPGRLLGSKHLAASSYVVRGGLGSCLSATVSFFHSWCEESTFSYWRQMEVPQA